MEMIGVVAELRPAGGYGRSGRQGKRPGMSQPGAARPRTTHGTSCGGAPRRRGPPSDPAGQGPGAACGQGWPSRPPARVPRDRGPVPSDGEGALRPAARAGHGQDGRHPGHGGARLAGAGRLHGSGRRQGTLTVQTLTVHRPPRRGPGPPNLLVGHEAQAPWVRAPRRTGSGFRGEEGPWPRWGRASPMNAKGWRAGTARAADANAAGSMGPWMPPPATSGRWSSPPGREGDGPLCHLTFRSGSRRRGRPAP